MVDREKKVFDHLELLNISYKLHRHPAVYTVPEAERLCGDIEGIHCKNLFLKNSKGNLHYLVVMKNSKRLDINRLSGEIGVGKLSFASEQRLEKYLGLEAGSVSPFGIINDTNKEVEVIIDEDLIKKGELINFHPNVNTATLTITTEDFQYFLDKSGNKVRYLEV
ncbi:Ala-tRNA(Pro) deacylase [Anaerovirgula multivorans]|uniref:Ala-tRNA(Pro) deacylase n=1 Tax=Anaerovirgula multivorans TaxID=312168 RepID=A0A239BBF7_9FIRM|nr:prolyl-tRNA synthetase associated domain-containing protein [Anaerovirgula multivorans]SNS04932.1 Ala-tRNA(Pro) deacylase [Anaerovirgula multivorans]